MIQDDFLATIDGWWDKTEVEVDAVIRQSVQETIHLAQKTPKEGGNMPVDTGFLRSSLMVSNLMSGHGELGRHSYESVSGMKFGDTIEFGWSAYYARTQEFGDSRWKARGFLTLAARSWNEIVKRNVAKVRGF